MKRSVAKLQRTYPPINFRWDRNSRVTAITEENQLGSEGVASRDILGAAYGTGYEGTYLRITVLPDNEGETTTAVAIDTLLLNNVSEADSERMDPTYSFGAPLIFTAKGKSPRIYVYQAQTLVNKTDGDSRSSLLNYYETQWKASALLTGKRRETPRFVELRYRNRIVTGVMLSMDMNQIAHTPGAASVVFAVFVYDEQVT